MAESYADALRFKAIDAFESHDFGRAIESFHELVGITNNTLDIGWRGLTLHLLGRYSDACADYELVLQVLPNDTFALQQLAQIKACCQDSTLRDGPMAVELATRLCELSKYQNWVHVSVLAAANAEIGDWEAAERLTSLTIKLAPDGEKERRRARLQQYQQHRPFRSSPSIDRSLLIRNR